MGKRMSKEKKDEDRYALTPMGCLYAVLLDYVGPDHLLDIRKIQGRVGEHIVDDFMDAMVRFGHVKKAEREEDEDDL